MKKGETLEKGKNWKEKRKEQTNASMEVAFLIEEDMEMHNFTMYDACNPDANDDCLIWYDWVADTATMSHITHQREAFIDYTPLNNELVTGCNTSSILTGGSLRSPPIPIWTYPYIPIIYQYLGRTV